jgi:hypothetical protein
MRAIRQRFNLCAGESSGENAPCSECSQTADGRSQLLIGTAHMTTGRPSLLRPAAAVHLILAVLLARAWANARATVDGRITLPSRSGPHHDPGSVSRRSACLSGASRHRPYFPATDRSRLSFPDQPRRCPAHRDQFHLKSPHVDVVGCWYGRQNPWGGLGHGGHSNLHLDGRFRKSL